MTEDLRTLLTDVAEGRVDPAEAARRMAEIDQTQAAGEDAAPPSDTPSEPSSAAADAPATRVLVRASARPVRVVADPTVATLTVEGPHTVRREGSDLRVEVPVTASSDAPGSYRYERKAGLSRWLSQATFFGVPLTIRINPDLALDVEVMAGSLDVVGLRAPLSFSVTAGSMKANDCTGPFNGTLRAGSAKLDVRPVAGASHVRVESGSLDVRLQPGSDATLRSRAELGEVKIKGADDAGSTFVKGDGTYEVVLGSGTASIDLDVVMGSVKVWLP